MNPDFPLAPWEVPPDSDVALVAPADEIFCATWRGGGARMLARKSEGVDGQTRYFVRDLASDEVGNWMLPREVFDLEHVIETIHRWPHTLKRCFIFDGTCFDCPGLYQLHITVKGLKLTFHDPADAEGRESYHRTELIHHPFGYGEFFECRPAELGRWARAQMEDAASPLGSALRWIRLSMPAKQCQYYGLSREEIASFKNLMVGVLRTQNTLWEPVSSEHSFLCNAPFEWRIAQHKSLTNDDSGQQFDQLLTQTPGGPSDWNHIIPPRLRQWHETLCGHFGLWPALETPYRDLDNYFMDSFGISVRVARPTAHEILEGAAVLGEWLKSVGEFHRFESLMAPDEPHLHLVQPGFSF